MKFKVDPNSELYQKLMEFKSKLELVDNEAKAFVKSVGGKNYARKSFGGINAVQFDVPPDKNLWRPVGPRHLNMYLPKAKNNAVTNSMNKLPYIKASEYMSIFGNPQTELVVHGDGFGLFEAPGLKFCNDAILLETPSGLEHFKPIDGMIEILESEYNELLKPKAAEAGN